MSTLNVSYQINVGGWSVDSSSDPRTEFIHIETCLSLHSPADYCRVYVYAPPAAKPGLMDQLAGAAASALGLGGASPTEEKFSVQIRGKDIKEGDSIKVKLTSGDLSGNIMTADIQAVSSSLGQTHITGKTGSYSLANSAVNQVFENQSFCSVAKKLAGQAGVTPGKIDTGTTYPYLVADHSKNLYNFISRLAKAEGLDLYFDTDNKLNINKFTKTSADHTFYYGIHILDLHVVNRQMNKDHITVYPESPSSNQGADTWHWIAKDISPFAAEIGKGSQTIGIHDGTVRTKDAAGKLGASTHGAIKDQSQYGTLKLIGNPTVKPADAIEIKDAPKPELNGLFKVTSVKHVLNKHHGYVTYVGFTGSGGADAAGDLLGGLAGALAGALGF